MNIVRFQASQPQPIRFGNANPQPNKALAIENFNQVQALLKEALDEAVKDQKKNASGYYKDITTAYLQDLSNLANATKATGIRLDYTHTEF